jgi:hypothetical protein
MNFEMNDWVVRITEKVKGKDRYNSQVEEVVWDDECRAELKVEC